MNSIEFWRAAAIVFTIWSIVSTFLLIVALKAWKDDWESSVLEVKELSQKLSRAKKHWLKYKTYLEIKYPATKGEPFRLKCPYHIDIDIELNDVSDTCS